MAAGEIVETATRTPWVTGWGRIDAVHAAARDGEGRAVFALMDAKANESLEVTPPLDLVAVRASATVRAHFHGHFGRF